MHPHRILIVEDDAAVRTFVSRVLEKEGYDITATADSSEAMVFLQREQFDLLLTDIVLPQMDGIALANEACMIQPHLRIILMSAYAMDTRYRVPVSKPKWPILIKPFGIREIRQAVCQHLAPA